jgi:predicted HTH transcriptional regulator
LVEHDGALVPSLAGLLSVGSYPQQFFPQLMVSVTVYPHEEAGRPGPNGIRFLDSAAVSGPVPTVVTDSIQVVQRNLQIKSRVVGGGGSGIIMMISQIRKDTGAVPLFAAGLDYFRVTIPRTSPVTPELRDWAKQLSGARKLSQPQISALALAKLGNDVDLALLRRLGLSASEARRELRQLRDLDLLRPRNSRDESTYRLAPGLPEPAASRQDQQAPGNGNHLAERILAALSTLDSASRDELQTATSASRSSVTNALDALIADGEVEPEQTVPPSAAVRHPELRLG